MIDPIPFGKRMIGPGHPVLIIAEIGINHEGKADACAKMIEMASRAGADAVKLQCIKADENYAPGTESHAIFSRAELTEHDTAELFNYAREMGMDVFATCGDPYSLSFIDSLEPAGFKISSGLITHLPLIRRAAQSGRTLLLSTGMADEERIERALESARDAGAEHLGLFQCTSIYPAPPEALHLRAISFLEVKYRVPVGFSDHSEGVFGTCLAVAAGAQMIEKHFTFDRSRTGFDHKISLPPDEFKKMVDRIRLAEAIMGESGKRPTETEILTSKRFYRKLVARRDIPKGARVQEEDIGFMRILEANDALDPSDLKGVLGRRLRSTLRKYSPITEKDLA